ncbi:MAG: hypothetical protein U1E38_07135 [Rhodospirillales bacterium]
MDDRSNLRRVRDLREIAALKYRPEKIDLLLIAEAHPAEKSRYFYFEHVSSNDWLFVGIAEILLGERPSRTNKIYFLSKLKQLGVFLIDVKPDPVDGTDLSAHIPDLIGRCAALEPNHIILIKANVYDLAYLPLANAGFPIINKRIYFPSTGRQADFRKQFSEALEEIPWKNYTLINK